MSRETLKDIIQDFSPERFIDFFRTKNRSFRPHNEYISEYDDNDFRDALSIGQIPFHQTEKLIAYSFRVTRNLTERSGKKAQYEIGKRILKDTNADAGIFIFSDANNNFRFSLIYFEYAGTQRKGSSFKRFTYFVSPEETNKTFIHRIGDGDFSSIEAIKEAFSVEKVTKEFYQEIANWYFWALENCRFPEDTEKLEKGRNIAIIRLITRIIFIWFMKVRGLVPDELFNEDKIREILTDISPDGSTYYKAILQNLFFATLNTRQDERKFRSEVRGYRGYNPDYGNHGVYRYHRLFKRPESLEGYFDKIPFLNGGLFECLDFKSRLKEDRVYIDGFTDVAKHQPSVPNFLFFSNERNVNLNKEFGTKNKAYKVSGLIDILSYYNFTIDENEPDDQEVALDPELLGKVFENLLASYNPETETTARKATGSYYTPREIVDYMVTQNLIQYFKSHLPGDKEVDEKIYRLFSNRETDNPFDEAATNKIIQLIESLRIVDPAVGTGAFPMGILNRLVFILHKLDPDNTLWKQAQIDAIKENVKDPVLQRNLIFQVEERFKDKNADYGRKLYLIEKCIYGVDIQQIAVEIAKLRFFISLLVDEKIDPQKPNLGIEPLPNLDFKLMQGNSLISSFAGIDLNKKIEAKEQETEEQIGLYFHTEYDRIIKEFEEAKDQYQNEPDKDKKDDLRKKIEKILLKIFEKKINEQLPELKNIEEKYGSIPHPSKRAEYIAAEKQKLCKKLGFDLEQAEKDLIAYTEGRKPKDFFLWDIYFAEVFHEKDGFDVVIGNPPYIRQEDLKPIKPILLKQGYEVYNSTSDIYTYFYEKGWQVLNNAGHLTFITSNKWMRAKYGENLRRFFKEKTALKQVIDFGGHKVFESATVDTNILLFQKDTTSHHSCESRDPVKILSIKSDFDHNRDLAEYFKQNAITMNQQDLDEKCFTFGDDAVMQLKKKIEQAGVPLKDWDVRIYRGIITGFNEAFIIDNETKERLCKEDPKSIEVLKPILRGRDIQRYSYKWAGLWLIKIESGWTNKHRGKKDPEAFLKDSYPAIYGHLKTMGEKLGKGKGLYRRDDQGDYWWELRDCDYYGEFEKEKMIYRDVGDNLSFAYEQGKLYGNNTVYFLNTGNKYLLAVVNSLLLNFYYTKISSQLGDAASRAFTIFIEQLPIPKIPESAQQPFITLVDQILSAKQKDLNADTSALERQIDKMVYELYGLTPREIETVNGGK